MPNDGLYLINGVDDLAKYNPINVHHMRHTTVEAFSLRLDQTCFNAGTPIIVGLFSFHRNKK